MLVYQRVPIAIPLQVELRASISDLKHRSDGAGNAPVTVCIALVLFCLQLP